jgi:dolichyl-phosphate-mannose-protein mannosyltransferase
MRHHVPAWVVPTAVTLAAGVLLLVRLGQPDGIVFDEIYYVEDARSYLDRGVEAGFAVHPPLGKWLIAAGIALAGDTPTGWRIAGALVGAAIVLLTVLVTRRLTGRPSLAALAGGLVALDGAFVVQARTAMLDVHLTGFIVLGAYLLVVDRQRPHAGGVLTRWPLALAGAAFGAAVATKWSGVFAVVAAVMLVAIWEVTDRPRRDEPLAHPTERRAGATTQAAGAVLAGLAAPALLVYALAWTPWLAQFEDTRTAQVRCAEQEDPRVCRFGVTDRLRGLVAHHEDMARFHLDLDAEHPYRAPATTWLVQSRPVVFHWANCGADDDPADCSVAVGNASEVVALGNLALWWGGLALLPVLLAGAIRRDGHSSVPLTFLAAQYLPWLVVARPVFSFYAVPLVPFLAAGVAVACGELDRPHRWLATASGTVFGAAAGAIGATVAGAGAAGVGTAAALVGLAGAAVGAVFDARRPAPARPRVPRTGTFVAGGIAVIALGLGVYFAPIWLAIELPEDAIRQRWWFPSWI